jgi:RNA polymerase sigma factor (sigma-70 family)
VKKNSGADADNERKAKKAKLVAAHVGVAPREGTQKWRPRTLVERIARKHQNRGQPLADLIQEGNRGLIEAADRFKDDRGAKFSTHATWWIRKYITRAIADHGRTIRLPEHVGGDIKKLTRAVQHLEHEIMRRPTPEEIAEKMGQPLENVCDNLRIKRPISLETLTDEAEAGSVSANNAITSPTNVLAVLESANEGRIWGTLLATLTPREEKVLRTLFGEKSDDALEEDLGVSRETIREIEAEALRKLRHRRSKQPRSRSRSTKKKDQFDRETIASVLLLRSAPLNHDAIARAVLSRSVKDLRLIAPTENDDAASTEDRDDALEWFLSEDTDPASFSWICEELGMRPNVILANLDPELEAAEVDKLRREERTQEKERAA